MANGQFQFLFLGDSVVWGQGLLEQEKFSTKLVAWVNQFHAQNLTVSKTVMAHSGAVIGVGKPVGGLFHNGEVPSELPSILDQCDRFSGDPLDVDVVITNGGINDVGVQYICNPLTDDQDLANEIDRHCRQHLTQLLVRIGQRYTSPNTRILVPGYYPVLSNDSNPLKIPAMLPLFGVSLQLFSLNPIHPIQKIISNFLLFWRKSSDAMQKAVDEANIQLGAAAKAVFVPVDIQPENSAFAPKQWIFAVNPDLSPQDSVVGSRRISCVAEEGDLLQREFCFRASAGHPNVWGADAYFRALYPWLQKLYGL